MPQKSNGCTARDKEPMNVSEWVRVREGKRRINSEIKQIQSQFEIDQLK